MTIGNTILNAIREKVRVAAATKRFDKWTVTLTAEEYSLLKRRGRKDLWIPRNRIATISG